MTHTQSYLDQVRQIAASLDHELLERMADELAGLRQRGGRLFLLGVGGSAANCSHAVNDFRKLAGIEAYSPCDKVAELHGRTNEGGWSMGLEAWLMKRRGVCEDGLRV